MAGINPTLLRAWERRYHLVSPQRTASGYRVYSERDIAVLRAAARLCAAGQTIGDVARLPASELLAAAERMGPATVTIDPSADDDGDDDDADPSERDDADPHTPSASQLARAQTQALAAIAAFDRQAFETALFPLTTMAGMGPVALGDRVLLPLLRAIGDEWEQGRLQVAAEHFGSALCRGKILQCLEFVARSATGPRVMA